MGRFAVSVFGRDRPGIVAAVTRVLADAGCNLEDTSMTILRGHFAMMLVVAGPAGAEAADLERGLAEVAGHQVEHAVDNPPEDTRAYFRGRCLAQYASEVVAASWDSVIFDVGRESLVRVPMMEPERGTKKHVGALFDKCESAKDLLEVITSR